jgi:hypothetical protein
MNEFVHSRRVFNYGYLINSPMIPGMKKNDNGPLTLHIQKDSPGAEKESNWLPVPDGPVNLVGWGLGVGIPVNRSFGFKLACVGIRPRENTGSDNDKLTIGCSLQW